LPAVIAAKMIAADMAFVAVIHIPQWPAGLKRAVNAALTKET
jgi:hypothetical protein